MHFALSLRNLHLFEFIQTQLDELFFHNSLRPKVICGDFAKGLAKVIATRETQRLAEGDNYSYILQLCEWHRVEAIKRRLVAVGRCPKMERDKIIDFI